MAAWQRIMDRQLAWRLSSYLKANVSIACTGSQAVRGSGALWAQSSELVTNLEIVMLQQPSPASLISINYLIACTQHLFTHGTHLASCCSASWPGWQAQRQLAQHGLGV